MHKASQKILQGPRPIHPRSPERFHFVTLEVPIIINLEIFQTKHTFWGRGVGSIYKVFVI